MTLTFRDFTFRAKHSLEGRSTAAAHVHWHTYTVRFWFNNAPDQDTISDKIESHFRDLHGMNLGDEIEDSTDEALAEHFLKIMRPEGCVKVTLTNDGQRGAEATL